MLDQKFIAVKKNKQAGQPRARRAAGPGRLRSWSGPVETDFQGRLRFSYANGPAHRLGSEYATHGGGCSVSIPAHFPMPGAALVTE